MVYAGEGKYFSKQNTLGTVKGHCRQYHENPKFLISDPKFSDFGTPCRDPNSENFRKELGTKLESLYILKFRSF